MNTFTVVSAVDYSTGIAKIGKCAIEDKATLKQANTRSQGIANMKEGREVKRKEKKCKETKCKEKKAGSFVGTKDKEPWMNLANAVIITASNDYVSSLKALKGYKSDLGNAKNKMAEKEKQVKMREKEYRKMLEFQNDDKKVEEAEINLQASKIELEFLQEESENLKKLIRKSNVKKEEIEEYFSSKLFSSTTNIDPNYLKNMLREKAKL